MRTKCQFAAGSLRIFGNERDVLYNLCERKILHTADFSLILPHTVAELLYYWCELSGF